MSNESVARVASPGRIDGWTALALAVMLLVYPAVYCSGIMGEIITPIFTEGSRLHWWYLWLALLAFHWIPFAFAWLALAKNGERWDSIGIDWSWFAKNRLWLGGLILLLVALAFVMPGVYYDALPERSQTIFMAPVSAPERLFVILGAATAGITEEVLFRGFAFTRLGRVIRSPWLVLPITVVSFVFIHGTPDDLRGLLSYVSAGLAFGIAFILMRQRRLEILVLIHFLIDASMVLAP
jgi:membrane protease YdiL (CAAX protease family)